MLFQELGADVVLTDDSEAYEETARENSDLSVKKNHNSSGKTMRIQG